MKNRIFLFERVGSLFDIGEDGNGNEALEGDEMAEKEAFPSRGCNNQ